MSLEMIAVKPHKYRTRRLLPGDHYRVKNKKAAKLHTLMGWAELNENPDPRVALDDARAKVALPPLSEASESIAELRDAYAEKFGKRPFNGWGAATLKAKMAEAD